MKIRFLTSCPGKALVGLLAAASIQSAQAGSFAAPQDTIQSPSYELSETAQFARWSLGQDGSSLQEPNGDYLGSTYPAISENGAFIGFTAIPQVDGADYISDGGAAAIDGASAYVKDRATGQLHFVPNQASAEAPAQAAILDISNDGKVLFTNRMVPFDTGEAFGDLFVYDLASQAVTRVNENVSGTKVAFDNGLNASYLSAIIAPNGSAAYFTTVNTLAGGSREIQVVKKNLVSNSLTVVSTFSSGNTQNDNFIASDTPSLNLLQLDVSGKLLVKYEAASLPQDGYDDGLYQLDTNGLKTLIMNGNNASSAYFAGPDEVRFFVADTNPDYSGSTVSLGNIGSKDLLSGSMQPLSTVVVDTDDVTTPSGGNYTGLVTLFSNDGKRVFIVMIGEDPAEGSRYIVYNTESDNYSVLDIGALVFNTIPLSDPFSNGSDEVVFSSAASDYGVPDNNTTNIVWNGAQKTAGVSDIYTMSFGDVTGSQWIDVSPESENVDPNNVATTNFAVTVTGQSFYGVQVSCDVVDETLLPVVGGSYGDIFDTNHRLEVDQSISSTGDSWDGAMSLKYPAEPVTVTDAWFSTVDMTVMPTSGVATVTCTGLAADIDGNPIDLGSDTETITLDDGIHCLEGACTDVTGVVTYPFLGDHSGIVVSITTADGVVLTTTTGSNGEYSFENIRDGEYSVSYESPEYVQECTAVNIDDGEYAPIGEKVMIAGDINNDDIIDISDFSLLAAQFGLDSGDEEFDASVDLNNDGSINIQDLVILGSHFGYNNCLPSVEEQQ